MAAVKCKIPTTQIYKKYLFHNNVPFIVIQNSVPPLPLRYMFTYLDMLCSLS